MNDNDARTLARIVRAGRSGERIAIDTETNARSIYSDALECRLVSLASRDDALVLPLRGNETALRRVLELQDITWVCHNAEFDRHVLNAALGVRIKDVRDTYVVAHLADPRQRSEGGSGHRLAELGARYGLKSKETDLLKARMKDNLWTWATIPIDDPVYRSYATTDARLTNDLLYHLDPSNEISTLEAFEYEVASVCHDMEARGVLVDQTYTESLVINLLEESRQWQARAAELGVANVNSPVQVNRALGTKSASKEILLPLAGLAPDWTPIGDAPLDNLAYAILKAKRTHRWATAYGQAFLDASQIDGRLHANITPLRARTARMAISNPPLQQLPAGEASVRRCLIADDGMVIWSVDYAAVEMRVLAALSKDKTMIELIMEGQDIHDNTATTIYGPGFTKAQRKLGKVAGFCTVYGGGVKAIMDQTGCRMSEAKQVRDGFLKAYPGVARLARQLAGQAERRGFVVSRTGRRMPVDRDRAYSSLNYVVQSTARDVFCEGMLRVSDAGLGRFALLPIHDELLGQATPEDAETVAHSVSVAMATVLDGVPIATDYKVGLKSWGSLYGATE